MILTFHRQWRLVTEKSVLNLYTSVTFLFDDWPLTLDTLLSSSNLVTLLKLSHFVLNIKYWFNAKMHGSRKEQNCQRNMEYRSLNVL